MFLPVLPGIGTTQVVIFKKKKQGGKILTLFEALNFLKKF